MSKMIRLAVTMGDPSDVGPEIIVKFAQKLAKKMADGRHRRQGSCQTLTAWRRPLNTR